jgi:hypothetical protein
MNESPKIQPRPEGPDFVGVGVQKSGTTWLGDVLGQHPQVLFAEQKEVSFFTRYFHRGYSWYHGIFAEKNGRLGGEISVNYMYSPREDSTHKEFYPKWNPRRKLQFWRRMPSARDELKAHYPGLKVFAMFRHPAERAWSHYWFWRNRKERLGKRWVPFEQMFKDDGRWIRQQGHYASLLAHWQEAFPGMACFFYDDIKQDPKGLARRVYRFVGVNEDFEPEIHKRVNPGRYEPMPEETRRMLIDYYRDQIERFQEMTGRDLSGWLEEK